MSSPLPSSLGSRFEIEAALPETPFERSFRAHDKILQREVLLKLPAREAFAAWSAPIHDRMLREARALAKLRHEHVAPIHWVEATPEGPLLVLDLPAGELLAERLRRGTLDVPETIRLGMQIGQALAHVHLQGVVHRAVGPSSIRLLANGSAQLGAFTFAKEFGQRGQGSSLAHAQIDGPVRPEHLPDYSAPEQLAGQTADPRADVFALGCTLFRCLAGQDAFPAGRPAGTPPDLRKLRPDVDRSLAEVIHKCLLFAKTARYATAQEVVDALQRLQQAGAAPRRPSRWGVAAVGAAAIAGLLWWAGSLSAAGTPGTRGGASAPVDPRYQRSYGRDYARVHGLFVAIGAYSDPQWRALKNPVREVDEVVAQLQANDPAWRREGAVQRLSDGEATLEAIVRELGSLERVDEEDAVLIYFSGHGARDGRSFGLCARDVKGAINVGSGFLRREDLLNFTDRCKAKHVLVVLDCCHSGAVFDLGDGAGRGRNPGGEVEPQPGWHHRRSFSREFLCSAGATQQAGDGDSMSPFCQQLLQELRQHATADRDYVAACHLAARIAEAMEHKFARGGMLQEAKYSQAVGESGSFVFLLPPR